MTAGVERQGLRRLALILLAIGVTFAFLLALGAFVHIPVLDILGSLVTSVFPWFVVACALLFGFALRSWLRHRNVVRAVIALLSIASVLGSFVIAGRMIAFASDQQLPIDAAQVLFGSHLDEAPDETVGYLEYGGTEITLSIWKPAASSKPAPVIVMTHGGGFTAGSVTTGVSPGHARWFADQGYLVIGANYTLATPTKHTWNVAEGQLACALAWSNMHAKYYGGDISRLGMFGDSAGGNLVINVAYKAAAGELTSSCGGSVPKVDAVSGIYPAVATIESYDNDDVLGVAGRQFLSNYHGGSPQRFPARYAATQSLNAISPAAPPTIVVYGESDHLVPAIGTTNFIQAARTAGVPMEAIAVPFGEHGFDAVNMGGVGSQVWRLATLKWFEGHGVGS